ncbi:MULTISPECIES: universal stress protein [Photobacterium]|uniref:Universal stress protein n=1 Tax=Photobacterium ganghwense TaxID=320778 RepID=A0A0J1H1W6_9GAMM|nr:MULTISPECIES: universal stress protein [Photobacterium]KLV05805.1 universal stress protein [Photobacterium ganghwense]MBV1839179.1 universal stress protein [Photobacterium ganghwense]PSU06344.1 universal stress protein [Photobacterium ganghwense]QSV14133.1 universal stress protein [Photobacterium ganghwense]
MALYQTILLAVDPDNRDAHTLMVKAGVIAQQNHAELHVAFVEPGLGNVSFLDAELGLEEAHRDLQATRIQQLSALSQASPYKVRALHIADGDVAKHLVELVTQIGANLVLIGAHKPGIQWYGNISQILSQQSRCDVLICQATV